MNDDSRFEDAYNAYNKEGFYSWLMDNNFVGFFIRHGEECPEYLVVPLENLVGEVCYRN